MGIGYEGEGRPGVQVTTGRAVTMVPMGAVTVAVGAAREVTVMSAQ